MVLSEVFWISFVTTASGFLLKMASFAYKSKCKEVSCCGIKILRDITAEVEETEFKITHPLPSPQIERDKSLNDLSINI
jgi:hypothetical protein